jgi:hypothetical protein
MGDLRMIRTIHLAFLLAFLVPGLATAQDPAGKLPAVKPEPPERAAKLPRVQLPAVTPQPAGIQTTIATARLARALLEQRTIQLGSVRWACRGATCTTTNLMGRTSILHACQQLRAEVGAIAAFGRDRQTLSASELQRCNYPVLELPAGDRVADISEPHPRAPRAREFPPTVIDSDLARRSACPDPAAIDLTARLVSRPSATVAEIEIAGVVRNVGRAAYESMPGQEHRQSIELTEGDGFVPPVVQREWFTDLAPGQGIRITHRLVWDFTRPAARTVLGTVYGPAPQPPRYRLRLAYASANRSDSNPNNDDCKVNNNEAVLESREIADTLY